MYRRYIIVGVVFFLLVGAYFLFFDNKKKDKEYEKYYTKLVGKDKYEEELENVCLSIDEIEENGEYSYIITFDNVSEKQENIKILVVNGKSKEDNIGYFPSFGIVENEGYSIVVEDEEVKEKELKGVNLTILDSEKIEYMLIYFKGNNKEQFVRVKVSNYLM